MHASVQSASERAPAGIYVHGEQWAFPTVANVLAALSPRPVRVELKADFPFGCGFGMSGACALATAYAMNRALGLGLSDHEIGMVAHHAEVNAATGLGDVGGQFNGGIMMKTIKYEPLKVHRLPVQAEFLYCKIYGPIHTAEVIGSEEKLQFINAAGNAALKTLVAMGPKLTLEKLFDVSLEFAQSSGLLRHPNLLADIAEVQASGGQATMIMLGEAVVSTIPFSGSQTVRVISHGAHLM